MNLQSRTKQLCMKWRKDHPSCSNWTDTEVIEAVLIRLCETHPDRITKKRGVDGVLMFKILPAALCL